MTVGTQIATHLGISTARVSQLATKGMKDGWLRKKGRHYAIKTPGPFGPNW